MRAVSYAESAVPAYDRQGVFSGKMDSVYNTGFGAFSAPDAFFFIMDDASAGPFRQRAGRAGNGACPFVFAGQAMYRKKFGGQAAHRTHFNGAFGIGIAFMVYAGAHSLACEAAYTFVHMVRF